jgi:hypothetical protein
MEIKREKGNKLVIERLAQQFNVKEDVIRSMIRFQYEFVQKRIKDLDFSHIDIPGIGSFKPRYSMLVHYQNGEYIRHPYDKEKQLEYFNEHGKEELTGYKVTLSNKVSTDNNVRIHLEQNGTRFKGYRFGIKKETKEETDES